MQDEPKYRTKKGIITMNVLGASTLSMEHRYVLSGWLGSAHDGVSFKMQYLGQMI